MKQRQEGVIVWGASGGVGSALIKILLKEERQIIAYARDTSALESWSTHPHLTARPFAIDESFYLQERNFLQQSFKIMGIADCVGGIGKEPHTSITARFNEIMEPNIYHQYLSTMILEPIIESGASIVFTSSIRALTGTDNEHREYSFAKAALENFTKSLVYTFKDRRIRVNCVRCTPIINTNISKKWPQTVIDELASHSIYNKLLTPEDVARVIQFLLSNDSQAITGSILDVNNGFLLHT